jgi:hypothetical protein
MQDTNIEGKQPKFRAVSIVGFIAGLLSVIFFIWLLMRKLLDQYCFIGKKSRPIKFTFYSFGYF